MKRIGTIGTTFAAAVTTIISIGGSELVAHAQTSTGLPKGFVCGMAYDESQSGGTNCNLHYDFGCNAFANPYTYTINTGVGCSDPFHNRGGIPGTVTYSVGDRGESTNFGFYSQQWNQNNSTASNAYLLPQGAACGFEENCNYTGETCMGTAAHVGCPTGWTQKHANDMNAPSGCNYYWCEYNGNSNCTNSSCYFSSQPRGTVCGISDSRNLGTPAGGTCMGLPPTISNCQSLGYVLAGGTYFDAGSSSGTGVGFCIKP